MKEAPRRLTPRITEHATTMKTDTWSMGSAPGKMGSKKWSATEKKGQHNILYSKMK